MKDLLEPSVGDSIPSMLLEVKIRRHSPLTKNSLSPEGAPSSVTAVTFCTRGQQINQNGAGGVRTSTPKIFRMWSSGLVMVALHDTNLTLLSGWMSKMV